MEQSTTLLPTSNINLASEALRRPSLLQQLIRDNERGPPPPGFEGVPSFLALLTLESSAIHTALSMCCTLYECAEV